MDLILFIIDNKDKLSAGAKQLTNTKRHKFTKKTDIYIHFQTDNKQTERRVDKKNIVSLPDNKHYSLIKKNGKLKGVFETKTFILYFIHLL